MLEGSWHDAMCSMCLASYQQLSPISTSQNYKSTQKYKIKPWWFYFTGLYAWSIIFKLNCISDNMLFIYLLSYIPFVVHCASRGHKPEPESSSQSSLVQGNKLAQSWVRCSMCRTCMVEPISHNACSYDYSSKDTKCCFVSISLSGTESFDSISQA